MGKQLIDAEQLGRLQAALRDCSAEVQDLAHSLLEDITSDVARDARSHVPHRSGRAGASYRSRGVVIEFGGADAPYVPWLEFGGRVGRKRSVLRAFNPQGRYVYPAIARNLKDVEKQVEDLIGQITAGFLEVE